MTKEENDFLFSCFYPLSFIVVITGIIVVADVASDTVVKKEQRTTGKGTDV